MYRGFVLIGALVLFDVLPAEPQQPKKVPRIGYFYQIATQLLTPPVPREFGWLCASLAT
jgi:hypothetical protein